MPHILSKKQGVKGMKTGKEDNSKSFFGNNVKSTGSLGVAGFNSLKGKGRASEFGKEKQTTLSDKPHLNENGEYSYPKEKKQNSKLKVEVQKMVGLLLVALLSICLGLSVEWGRDEDISLAIASHSYGVGE